MLSRAQFAELDRFFDSELVIRIADALDALVGNRAVLNRDLRLGRKGLLARYHNSHSTHVPSLAVLDLDHDLDS